MPQATRHPARAGAVLGVVVAVTLGGLAAPASAASTLSRTSDRTWQTNGAVADVLTVGSRTYLAGDFTSMRPSGRALGSGEVRRVHLAAVSASTGALVESWRPTTNGTVDSIAARGDVLYLGGSFSTVNGQPRSNVAAVSLSTGALLPFTANTSGRVKALAASSTRLYLGGSFTSVKGVKRTRLAAVDLDGARVSTTWKPAANDTVSALALGATGDASVYAGGSFTAVNGDTSRRRLVKISASTGALRSWASNPGYPVLSIDTTSTKIYVGGDGAGGHAGSYSLSGTRGWVLQTDGGVNAVAVRDGVLYVGGHFDNVCKGDTAGSTNGFTCPDNRAARSKIVAVSASSGALDPWDPGANSIGGVTALDATSAALHVGGEFTKLGRVPGSNTMRPQQGYGSFR